MARMVLMVLPVSLESPVTFLQWPPAGMAAAEFAHKDRRESLASLDQQDHRDLPDQRESQANLDSLAKQDHLALRDHLVQRAKTATPVRKVQRDRTVREAVKDLLDQRVHLETAARQVHRDRQDRRDRTERVELQDHRAHRDHPAQMERLVLLDHRARKDLPDRMHSTVRARSVQPVLSYRGSPKRIRIFHTVSTTSQRRFSTMSLIRIVPACRLEKALLLFAK